MSSSNRPPERIVVIGYGPVAARLVDELVPAVRAGRVDVLVLGEEADPAYNRVLVADVGVGRTVPGAIALSDPAGLARDGVRVLTGARAVAVDRESRQVLLADGSREPYDRLVLATGARAAIPPLDGLGDGTRLPAGVTGLRDLADAARLLRTVQARGEIVVLGGGVLGLEAALAAAEAGAHVTVVHHDSWPMSRSLDLGGGRVLTAALRRHGVQIVPQAAATGVLTDPGPDGRPTFRALELADGTDVTGDLLLISCGVRPNAELASECGLPVGRGILVDHGLRADGEGRIFAIGDCAEVLCGDPTCVECCGRAGRGPSGLIGTGWRQAEWLAARLVDLGGEQGPLEPERPGVILLKARSLDLAAAGDVSAEPWDDHDADGAAPIRVSQWADPEHGRYAKMVTRGGVLTGLVCVGMSRTAAELVLLYERGEELPADRTAVLRWGTDGEAPATPMGPDSTVCRCSGATLGCVEDAIASGCGTVCEVGRATRAGTGCGSCHDTIKDRLAAWATDAATREAVA